MPRWMRPSMTYEFLFDTNGFPVSSLDNPTELA
jgi:hypothetical protein